MSTEQRAASNEEQRLAFEEPLTPDASRNLPAAIRNPDERRAYILDLHTRLRACRRCHAAGYLDERVSVPLARDPDPGAPLPRILLVGQAPSAQGTRGSKPFAGIGGEKLRGWFAQAGLAPDDFFRKITFSAVTKCYPGPARGGKGDRVPTAHEQALCRPWTDAILTAYDPAVILLVGTLAIKAFLGSKAPLTELVGHGFERDGRRLLPLPHPSGVSTWLNDDANVARVEAAMMVLRGWVAELEL
jgi:uracil-DNA glycosylase